MLNRPGSELFNSVCWCLCNQEPRCNQAPCAPCNSGNKSPCAAPSERMQFPLRPLQFATAYCRIWPPDSPDSVRQTGCKCYSCRKLAVVARLCFSCSVYILEQFAASVGLAKDVKLDLSSLFPGGLLCPAWICFEGGTMEWSLPWVQEHQALNLCSEFSNSHFNLCAFTWADKREPINKEKTHHNQPPNEKKHFFFFPPKDYCCNVHL